MDYGRQNLENNRKKLSSRKNRAQMKLALVALRTVLVGGLLIVAGISVVAAMYIHKQISAVPDISEVDV